MCTFSDSLLQSCSYIRISTFLSWYCKFLRVYLWYICMQISESICGVAANCYLRHSNGPRYTVNKYIYIRLIVLQQPSQSIYCCTYKCTVDTNIKQGTLHMWIVTFTYRSQQKSKFFSCYVIQSCDTLTLTCTVHKIVGDCDKRYLLFKFYLNVYQKLPKQVFV